MNMFSKIKKLIIAFVFLGLPVYAQLPSPVSLQFGVGIGSVSPSSDFTGTTVDYYSGKNYGQSSGINYQVKARFGVIGLNLVGQLDYASFSNDGYSEPGTGSIDISQKVLSLKLGPEFKLNIPLVPVTPYFGVNLSYNNFTGNVSFQGVAHIIDGNYEIKSDSRIGYGISGGVIVNLIGITIDVGAQYNILNAFGKKFEDVHPTIDQRIDSYLALNDAQDPLYSIGDSNHFISNSRTISSFAITATVMFGI